MICPEDQKVEEISTMDAVQALPLKTMMQRNYLTMLQEAYVGRRIIITKGELVGLEASNYAQEGDVVFALHWG